MKKTCILVLIAVMLFSLSMLTYGSTIGVNVSQGSSVSVEKPDTGQNSFKLIGNFGFNNKLLVWLSYTTESEEDNVEATPQLGIRYELTNNFAGILGYSTNDTKDTIDLGIRAKKPLTKRLALVGEAKYLYYTPNESDSYSGYSVLAQAEYVLTPLVTVNYGINTTGTDQEKSEAATNYLVGVELYPSEQLTWWVDYGFEQDTSENKFGLGVEYQF